MKNLIVYSLLVLFCSCQAQPNKNPDSKNKTPMENELKNPYYSRTDTKKLQVSDAEWKKVLSPDLYAVARENNTERAFTGKYWDYEGLGTYYCACCGNALFNSDSKFSSSCGWPSFFETLSENSVIYKEDKSHGMERTEVLCGRCDSHLGHIFDDGPPPTHKRYCMNSISLEFEPMIETKNNDTNSIVLGGGCFWCIEAMYKELNGVTAVESGYAGGNIFSPSYEQVSTGNTGAAEVIKVTFDPKIISLSDILFIFFDTHDPTSLNKQGADVGTQYRSAIFYTNDEQKQLAKKMIQSLTAERVYDKPIVTTVEKLTNYQKAEEYHQDYYSQNKTKNGYCNVVITPKLEKFKKKYKERLKK